MKDPWSRCDSVVDIDAHRITSIVSIIATSPAKKLHWKTAAKALANVNNTVKSPTKAKKIRWKTAAKALADAKNAAKSPTTAKKVHWKIAAKAKALADATKYIPRHRI